MDWVMKELAKHPEHIAGTTGAPAFLPTTPSGDHNLSLFEFASDNFFDFCIAVICDSLFYANRLEIAAFILYPDHGELLHHRSLNAEASLLGRGLPLHGSLFV